MKKSPIISVIVPCYGVERYLDRCVDSLLNQTFRDIEIILVDDGSPDSVPQMCDDYASRDERVKVVHKKNGGLGYARNSGLEIASGRYVAFVDSDDYVATDLYENLHKIACDEQADAVFCGFNQEIAPGHWNPSDEIKELTIFVGDYVTDFMLDMVANSPKELKERRYHMSVWRAIYRRDIIEDNHLRFLSERDVASEDIPFQVDFLLKSSKVVYTPKRCYYYCNNPTSLSSTFKSQKYDYFKRLRKVLGTKLQEVRGGQERCDRLFIGYVRSHIYSLPHSLLESKLREIHKITSDSIWRKLAVSYPASNLRRLDQRLMYWLILKGFDRLVFINCIGGGKLRKIQSYLK